MIPVHNEPVSPWVGRLLGIVLALAGWAAGSTLWSTWNDSSWDGPTWKQRAFVVIAALICQIAIIQGVRMTLAPLTSDLPLPRPVLAIGAILLLFMGVVQIILAFVMPEIGSVWAGLGLGIGGAIGAAQLYQQRGRNGLSDGA